MSIRSASLTIAVRVVLRSLAATWRIVGDAPADCHAILSGQRTAVIAFWHCQMFPLWFHFRRLKPSAVVSMSNDGAMLADYLKSLGYTSVLRGSSTRRGSIVLNEAVQALATTPVLMTPDGPRGPARQAKAGALVAALRADVPLVAVGWSAEHLMRIGSWDNMEVPMPFSTIRIRFKRFTMPPIGAADRISDEELARLSSALDEVSGPAVSG
ncbi:MAG: DUF374 domain-containing protein [bacterium]|nr:DUF374 domain-containing protein [Candidatus Kapabacteria bacterium]